MARQTLVLKLSNTKFRENHFSDSRVLLCTRTDGQGNFNGRSTGNQARLKNREIGKQYYPFELPQENKERKQKIIN
jgi:hypothetical protein